MRESKFRGYSTKDNEWRYGFYVTDNITHEILTKLENNEMYASQIDFISLGQYTGLKDAINKNEIYEHDIINLLGVGFLKVEWDYKHTGWICLDKHYKKRNLADVLLNGGIRVGNIYENQELLEDK